MKIYIVKGIWKTTAGEEMGAVAVPCSTLTTAKGVMLETYEQFREDLMTEEERQTFKIDPDCLGDRHLFAQCASPYDSTYLDLEIVEPDIR